MNVLIDIGHPGHIHLFKHTALNLERAGYRVIFTSRDKECSIDLLEHYDFEYYNIGKPFKSGVDKLVGLYKFAAAIHRIAKLNDVQLFLSVSSMYAAHVSFLMGKPHIVMDDTEHSKFEHMLYRPFSTHLVNPSCFEKNFGSKQIKYRGYHELAYLHPNYFKKDATIYKELGLDPGEPYSLVRFVAWNAGHDIKESGMKFEEQLKIVELLKSKGRVLISSEKELPKELKEYKVQVAPSRMHQLLAHAIIYIGEGATMASECAALGTPAIYINTLNAGTLKEQEDYGLIYGFRNFGGVLERTKEIIEMKNFRLEWQGRRQKMLTDKIDVTQFITDLAFEAMQVREIAA